MMWPGLSQAYLYATLDGHEADFSADGRDVHFVVAGYGNELGMSTYQMAVSRAKKLKENFPNDRVIILGSTSYHEGTINHRTTPERLERDYDISIHRDFKEGGRWPEMVTAPLTSDIFTGSILSAITVPSSMDSFYRMSGPVNQTDVANAIRSGRIEGAGKIKSLDFISHSSPTSGIFLHNSENYYDRVTALEGQRAQARGENVVVENGVYYIRKTIPVDQRSLTAASSEIAALNGMFTDDAYVNMAGCSGGFGVVDDLSRALGVPVSGTANGSEIYVMAQDGDYYYNGANPYEDKALSDSMYSMLGHEFGANNDSAPPMNFKPALVLYNGYWGNLSSGTNFTMTACVVRDEHKADDTARCEMGMARRIEDSLTPSSSNTEKFEITDAMSAAEKSRVATAKYRNFLDTVKENMCPDNRGYSSARYEPYKELREQCFRAIEVLGALSMNCKVKSDDLIAAKSVADIESQFPSSVKDPCSRYAQEYIEKHKYFVPLLDQQGKTLFCDISGCKVRLKGCEVTTDERRQCWNERANALNTSSPGFSNIFSQASCYSTEGGPLQCLKAALCPTCASDQRNDEVRNQMRSYDNCLKTKRCEIDEEYSEASNKNNPTFMNYIQHYINGYEKLELYRRGDLQIHSDHPPVLPFENASPSSLRSQSGGIQ